MTALVAVRGPLASLDAGRRALLLDRSLARDGRVAARTRELIEEVRCDGDAALRRQSSAFDGVSLDALEVPAARRRTAVDGLDPGVRAALERAAENIRAVHGAFRPVAVTLTTRDGVRIGRRPDPLRRAGVYAPGGRAAYASSVLMGVVPARVAGVAEIIVCSPPGRDGVPADLILAAADIAGADRVFAAGGAGAIAAMTFGTTTIPRVDRITGPGNAWVAEAKVQVAGIVGVDAPAGPSELLVVAGAGADPATIARELAAQAEHDPDAAVALVALDGALCDAVATELRRLLADTPRADIVARSLASRGALLTGAALPEVVAFCEAYAPEHLLLIGPEAESIARIVRNAGTVFVGAASSVVFGDYLTGANHVLPTGGAARAWSGLSTSDFVRWTTWQEVPAETATRLAADTMVLAAAEGLPAHAAAARAWSA